jgi:prepilin-type N-terminal cleavage/methylation domain-containing protein
MQRGFTLIELLIVCLLITISLAISIPTLRHSLVSDQLGAGSRKVISLLTSARGRAARDGVPQLISFNLSERKIWYEAVPDRGSVEGEDKTEADDKSPVRSQIQLPEGIRIEEISQAGGGDDYDPLTDGLWISKQGYMDKTFIRLSDEDNETLYLLIMPYFFDIAVKEEFFGFE